MENKNTNGEIACNSPQGLNQDLSSDFGYTLVSLLMVYAYACTILFV